MKKFRTLDLATDFYSVSRRVQLPGYLKNQLLRASSSVALNLSEGRGRRTTRDQLRFFQIAFGSIRECQAIVKLHPMDFESSDKALLDRLAASCYQLIRHAG